MDTRTYQRGVEKTMNSSLNRNQELANYTLGLAGETGEVVELVKKHMFHGHDLDIGKMVKELGDVAWYIVALCNTLDIQLDLVLESNLEKLAGRYPAGFSSAASLSRVEDSDAD